MIRVHANHLPAQEFYQRKIRSADIHDHHPRSLLQMLEDELVDQETFTAARPAGDKGNRRHGISYLVQIECHKSACSIPKKTQRISPSLKPAVKWNQIRGHPPDNLAPSHVRLA